MSHQARTRTRRLTALLAVAAIALAGLTSCTPVIKGITGLTVDAEGRPLAVVAWWASQPPDIVVLWVRDESASPTVSSSADESPQGRLRSIRQVYEIPPDAESPAMVTLPGFPSLLEGEDISLRMFGVADDNSFTSEAQVSGGDTPTATASSPHR